MIKTFKKGSTWLGLFEQLIAVCPTLGTVLYYYFDTIQESVSWQSQFSFGMAIVLLVFFMVFKRVAKVKIDELRQSVVQTETDLKNEPENNTDRRALLALNARKDRTKLDMIDRFNYMLIVLIIALAVYIMERAMIGLTSLALIALASILAATGIHIGVLKLKEREATK